MRIRGTPCKYPASGSIVLRGPVHEARAPTRSNVAGVLTTWLGPINQYAESGGALAMRILSPVPSAVQFCDDFLRPGIGEEPLAPDHINDVLPALISGIALSDRKRTQTELGAFVLEEQRSPATIGRVLQDRRFNTRDIHRRAIREFVRLCAPAPQADEVHWLLSIDGTALQRGADTLIRGANHFRGKSRRQRRTEERAQAKLEATERAKAEGTSITKAKKKGRATKAFTFLIGCLITHTGVRIPLLRRTCDPKDFKRVGRPPKQRLTQIDLAKIMIQEALDILPANVRLVVLADAYFDAKKLFIHAQGRKKSPPRYTLITPADTARCFANTNSPSKSNGERLHDRGLSLPLKDFEKVDLVRGAEETASLRRYANRKPRKKDRRTYWVHHENETVAGLGEVGVVYSWKTPVYRPKPNFRDRTFKVLLCSDPELEATRVVELYEIRWTGIEILFRELKQDLGFGDYVGTSLEAMERYLDLVLITLIYLEVVRKDYLDGWGWVPKKLQRQAETARVRGMQELVRLEVEMVVWDQIQAAPRSPKAKQQLERLFTARATELGAVA